MEGDDNANMCGANATFLRRQGFRASLLHCEKLTCLLREYFPASQSHFRLEGNYLAMIAHFYSCAHVAFGTDPRLKGAKMVKARLSQPSPPGSTETFSARRLDGCRVITDR